MKILIIHNHYLEAGGEDEVVAAEKRMLEQFGHKVILFERSNEEIDSMGFLKKARFVLGEIYWSQNIYRELREIIQKEKPDLAHIHNTFIRITPSVYDACQAEKVPVVQTFHNYRFLCPVATFYRDGHVCEDCLKVGRVAGVIHRCWKKSFIHSLTLKNLVDKFYSDKIFPNKITKGIVLSEFSRQMYTQHHFDKRKLFVKPNFIDFDPGVSEGSRNYALFVGALRDYKGIQTLLKAWPKVNPSFPLKIIGDGPLRSLVENSVSDRIEFLGRKPLKEMIAILKEARFVVVPSECYENFPRIIAEAFASGVPVLASRLGAMKELIIDHKTGLFFNPGDTDDLARQANVLIKDSEFATRLGLDARLEYEKQYTMEKNYKALMAIYQSAIEDYSQN